MDRLFLRHLLSPAHLKPSMRLRDTTPHHSAFEGPYPCPRRVRLLTRPVDP